MIAAKIKTSQGNEEARRAIEVPWGEAPKEVTLHQGVATAPPNPEVQAKAARRRFTAEYKLRVLTLADACKEPGCLGKLLRQEGLYASNLDTWRGQRNRGVLSGLTPKKRGRKESVRNPLVAENQKLRKENERLTNRLRQAEIINDVQKKISQLLGIPIATDESGGTE
jgi:transposase-like protein